MRIKRRLKINPELDMTPMIDCVFLLLIFFLLSSSFILQPGIKVRLPESSVQGAQTEKSVEVILTQENLLFYDTERLSIEELKLKFRSLAQNAPQTVVVVKADGNAKHNQVVEILAAARENKLNRLAIATRPREPSS